ncbi:CoA transferase [Lutimonas sp.]|uniref:CoA transferase n=1 Tax=Lutimonas sp. TaxID=1872403 RepID=UPI003D9BF133
MKNLPYHGIIVYELSNTVAGRLTGLLFADQGAEVYIKRKDIHEPIGVDQYFDRNKYSILSEKLNDTSPADIIIVDGDTKVDRTESQIVVRITAAVPGDEIYGYLPADCSEDLLNALVGFYTDMGTTSKILGRPVIYTPLPLCSVYTGVNAAVATGAALVDRERCGLGREIVASRIAGGVSAIGALALTSEGIPPHLAPTEIGGIPEGMTPEEFKKIIKEASEDPAKQLWLEQRLIPLAAPYYTSDNRLALPLAAPNRRNTQRICKTLGVWDEMLEAGMVDVSPYDPDNIDAMGKNAADSMALNFTLSSKLAGLLEEAFLKKTADEWEEELCNAGIPCVKVMTWNEWKNDPKAKKARIFANVNGLDKTQLGRASWVTSAQPYPDLEACKPVNEIPSRQAGLPPINGSETSYRPLKGYVGLDFTNVVAGPNCGRMFSELGATIYKIDPMNPFHSPTIMTTWAGESGVGKKAIILDIKTDDGRKILNQLIAKADFIIANKLDPQFERLGLDRKSLDKINKSVIGVQLAAHSGERHGPRHNYPGYDPALQGTTGLTDRFGPKGCPTYHGVASCVDYLCGYLGAWAGVTALVGRERRKDGIGDWAETSLATAASLTQLLLQYEDEPKSARGAYATGMNEGERVYEVSDGWIFAEADHDISMEISSFTVENSLVHLKRKGIMATPVQTCKELADRHRDSPTPTVYFERHEKDGWINECFAPTWFVFDGKPYNRPSPASRIGSDAQEILEDLGYNKDQFIDFVQNKVVGQTEWIPVKEKQSLKTSNTNHENQEFDINQHLDQYLEDIGLSAEDCGGEVVFTGKDPILHSHIRLGACMAVPAMACGIGAAAIWKDRTGEGQNVSVDLREAVMNINPFYKFWVKGAVASGIMKPDDPLVENVQFIPTVNGQMMQGPFFIGNPVSFKIFESKDGRKVTATGLYDHHLKNFLNIIGAPPNEKAIAKAIAKWNALDLEEACFKNGAIFSIHRTTEEWANHPQGQYLSSVPLIEIEKIGDSAPIPFSKGGEQPLSGIKTLSMTHVIAGTTAARTLAQYGSEVLHVARPQAFEHEFFVTDVNVGMRSTFANIKDPDGQQAINHLLPETDVIVQNMRSLDKYGLGPEQVAEKRPGIIYLSANCYGHGGPWGDYGGFDMEGCSVSGITMTEGDGVNPKYPPTAIINDFLAGYIGASGVMAALRRRAKEGGIYHVKISLTRAVMWYSSLGLLPTTDFDGNHPDHRMTPPQTIKGQTPYGEIHRLAPLGRLSKTPSRWRVPFVSVRGASPTEWEKQINAI